MKKHFCDLCGSDVMHYGTGYTMVYLEKVQATVHFSSLVDGVGGPAELCESCKAKVMKEGRTQRQISNDRNEKLAKK